MTVQWETIHIFISSTFNDMHAERDYLVKSVFPELSEWCEKRKLRLIDIDLRWGVTEQDALHNKNVVKVCLDRIDYCRPFFLCFLGQRRGWVPKKEPGIEISEDTFIEFPGLRKYAGKDSVTEMEIRHAVIEPLHDGKRTEKKPDDRYYLKADHAFFYLREKGYIPPQLKKIYTNKGLKTEAERTLADNQLEHWRDDEIREKFGRSVHDYVASWKPKAMTPELLIPLQSPSEEEENIKQWQEAWNRVGVKVTGTDIEEDDVQAKKAHQYNQHLIEGRLGDFLVKGEPLSQIIIQDLKEAIAARYPDHIEIYEETDLQKELDQQEQFLFIGSEGFIKRENDFAELSEEELSDLAEALTDLVKESRGFDEDEWDEYEMLDYYEKLNYFEELDDFTKLDVYVRSESDQLYVVTAPAGLGKSTLLANWINHHKEKIAGKSEQSVHFRFIGQSEHSSNVYSLLQFLLRELKEIYGKFEADIPDDPRELRKAFPEFLKEVGSKGKTVIVIDALNQLETGLDDLSWLSYQLPENVKLIVSFKTGESPADDLLERMEGKVIHSEVRPFENLEHRKQLVVSYLEQYLKQLDERHLQTLIGLSPTSNPLYLKVVLSELRVFGSFINLGEKIRAGFGDTPVLAFSGILRRLEKDPAYTSLDPEKVVPLLFGLLAYARQGLSVKELTAIFLDELSMEKTERNRKEVADTIYHCLRQVRPFMTQRDGHHGFFFESFRIAARERYTAETEDEPSPKRISCEWHRLLAAYFDGIPIWFEIEDAEKPVPNTRKLAEQPYHQGRGELGEELVSTLTNFQFLDAKVQALGPQFLIEDFEMALFPRKNLILKAVDKAREDLILVQRALRLSITVLSKFPDQTSSQLTGRLLYNNTGKIQHLLAQIRKLNRPWLRPLTQSLIQAGGALIQTIPVTGEQIKVAISPDANWMLTSNEDGVVEAWDFRTGKKYGGMKIDSVSDEDNSIAISLDGQYLLVVIQSEDSLELWNLSTETQLSIFNAVIDEYPYSIDHETGRIQADCPPTQNKRESNYVHPESLGGRSDPSKIEFGKTSDSTQTETPDGRFTVTPILENLISILDNELDVEAPQVLASEGFNNDLVISPNGLYIAYIIKGDASVIRIYDFVGGYKNFEVNNPCHNWRLAFSPDSRRLISFGKKICTWDLDARKKILEVDISSGLPEKIVVSPDSSKVFAVYRTAAIHAWDLETGAELQLILQEKGYIGSRITLTPDSRFLVFASRDQLLVWDSREGVQVNKFHDTIGIRALSVTPDAHRLIAGGNKKLIAWDLLKGDEIWILDGNSQIITDVAISPDGRRAISVSSDGVLNVWDLDTGKKTTSFSGESAFTKCDISHDGMTVIAGEESNLLHILRLEGVPSLSSSTL
jgi:WD40 repeat protein